MRLQWFIIALLVLPLKAGLAQTSAVVDEATFTVTEKGASLGRESFRIARTPAPGGQVFLVTGTSALGESRVTSSLGTDSLGVPVSYEAVHAVRGQFVERLKGRGRPGRFSVVRETRSGESAREYVLSNAALLIDEDVFHHFYFVPVARSRSDLIVIAPRSAQHERFGVQERGAEQVEVAGRSLNSRRFALVRASGASQDVWVDEKGRLLKVSIPERGLIALRDDPPR
jgi:hypothetical protein